MKIDLPATAQSASVDVIYLNVDAKQMIALNGLNAAGQVVATTTLTVPARTFFVDSRLAIQSLNRNIIALMLVTSADIDQVQGFGDAIDNVTFDATPEPTGLLPIAAAALLLRRGRAMAV